LVKVPAKYDKKCVLSLFANPRRAKAKAEIAASCRTWRKRVRRKAKEEIKEILKDVEAK